MSETFEYKKWAMGIVGAVITAIAIWWIEKPVVKPLPAAPVVVEGRVIDAVQEKLIPNAKVSLNAGAYSTSQETDSDGRYGFSVEGVEPTASSTMEIEAAGYEPRKLNETLAEFGGLNADQELTSLNAGTAGGASTGGSGNSGAQKGGVVLKHPGIAAVEHPAPQAVQSPVATLKLPPYVRRAELAHVGPAAH